MILHHPGHAGGLEVSDAGDPTSASREIHDRRHAPSHLIPRSSGRPRVPRLILPGGARRFSRKGRFARQWTRGKEDVMRTDRLIPRTAFFCSLVLGQASLLLGLMLALGWSFAFVLIV